MSSVPNCRVPGCPSVLGEAPIGGHLFPTDNRSRRTAWIEFCGAEEHEITSCSFLCRRHFPEEAYQPSYGMQDLKEWRLVAGAVPSLCPPTCKDRDQTSDPFEISDAANIVEVYLPVDSDLEM